ncbi:hypothetical protein Pfo_019670 [Paulownia fortunei]|nr:hypothetical protein Pfo_019670 [Paulownia fortunei]
MPKGQTPAFIRIKSFYRHFEEATSNENLLPSATYPRSLGQQKNYKNLASRTGQPSMDHKTTSQD